MYSDFKLAVVCDGELVDQIEHEGFLTNQTIDEAYEAGTERVWIIEDAIENDDHAAFARQLQGLDAGNVRDRDTLCALLRPAIWIQKPRYYAELRRRGAPVNCESNYYDQPLAVALQYGAEDMVVELLGEGADPNVPLARRVAPLTVAAEKG